ncbi:hypothetical protein ACLB2K_008545 [Fragaria x ananassa]
MACVTDESWVALPKMLSERLSLREEEEVEEEPGFFDSESAAYRLEKVFPVYALGIPKPEPDPVVEADSSGDPIWDAVREEAKLEAEKEPILSSFLYASILAHDRLEQALAFVLANRLQNPTLLATQLMDIFSDVMMHDRDIQRSVRLDVQAFEERDPACLSYCSALLYLKGYHALQVYRVAHSLWTQGRKVLALALQSRVSEVFGVDIHPGIPAKVIGYVDEKDPSLTMKHDATKEFFENVAVNFRDARSSGYFALAFSPPQPQPHRHRSLHLRRRITRELRLTDLQSSSSSQKVQVGVGLDEALAMSEETEAAATQMEENSKPRKRGGDSNGDLALENGSSGDAHDQLVQMVTELKFQNEFLKSQIEGFQSLKQEEPSVEEGGGGGSEEVEQLRRSVESLSAQLEEERQTRAAAEVALKHLREEHLEADSRAQDLAAKLAEAQQKLDREIKEREEKYSDLDSKFTRLHKRAKQRIQDVQKEKDDLEARFREVNERAERALSQQTALQQELDKTRQQANDALKAIDAERQQLRSANNKLRDNLEELRNSLQPKESAIEALQHTISEKDQLLDDMRGLLQAADEKRQASIAELSAKHQKNLESLEAQLADASSERNKATETISSLQMLVAEKESKIAEMEAASTGEAVRLRAAAESVKGELAHLKHEHEKEKESWEAASRGLKMKLEVAESNRICAEIEVAKMRSQLESEVSAQTRMLDARDAELATAKEEINRLKSEFSSYKVRAHALLQKKDADLAAAKDSEQVTALEEALKEAEKEVSSLSAERDKALQDLQDALTNYNKELAERDAALNSTMEEIKSLEKKLENTNAHHRSAIQAWEVNLTNLEETWRARCETLRAQSEASSGDNIKKELDELKLRYKKLKEEHSSFRDLADRMTEEKDREISRLVDENKNLHQSLESRPQVDRNDNYNTGMYKQDAPNLSTSALEQQILILARQQAQREEELAQSQRHILALQEEIEELERENRLHSQQETMLKTELRNMERSQKREGVDMTYLKNVILKLLETGEVEALLPVVGMLLQFSPEEIQKCQQAYRVSADVPPSPASDTPGSATSLFSRFSFT